MEVVRFGLNEKAQRKQKNSFLIRILFPANAYRKAFGFFKEDLSMLRSMYSGVAGLKTHQTKMDVIGNNIANVNTTAYKAQQINFSDLMYQTTQNASGATATTGGVNAKQIGLGSMSASISTAIESQGATQTTNNPFDIMINGNQFFVVNSGTQNLYTRDGSFYVDGDGNLAMQSKGFYVMGWKAEEDDTGALIINTTGELTKLQVKSKDIETYPPEGTTQGLMSGNIDKNDKNVLSSAGKTLAMEFYDNKGYLYTAKFTVKDTDTLNRYTLELSDVIDSTNTSIGKAAMSQLTFGSNVGEEDRSLGKSGTLKPAVYGEKDANGNIMFFRSAINGTTYTSERINTPTTIPGVYSMGGTTTFTADQITLMNEAYNGTFSLDNGVLKFTSTEPNATALVVSKYTVDDKGNISFSVIDPVNGSDSVQTGYSVLTVNTNVDPNTITFQDSSSTQVGTSSVPMTYTDGGSTALTVDQARILSTVMGGTFSINGSSLRYTNTNGETYTVDSYTIDASGAVTLQMHDKAINYEMNRNSVILNFAPSTGNIANFAEGAVMPIINFTPDVDDPTQADGDAAWTDITVNLQTLTNVNTNGSSTITANKGDKNGNNEGRKLGKMTGISVAVDGKITASYSNGQSRLIGQIASATFANASGLEKQGDNLYASTMNSGDPAIQDITVSGGSMTTGVLEMSNVDLSSEFTNMITAQRGFQANSRIITVSDTLLEELTNLKR